MLKSDLLTPARWNDYELLDSGNFEKLERFGRYVVARPEPQALWNRSLSDAEWRQRADAVFRKDRRSEDRGEWVCKPGMPGQWFVEYGGEAMRLCFIRSVTKSQSRNHIAFSSDTHTGTTAL